jgi:hypothetical protein
VELKLNGTHQLVVYADDVNLRGGNIDAIKKNTGTLIDASREVDLEVIGRVFVAVSSPEYNSAQNFCLLVCFLKT